MFSSFEDICANPQCGLFLASSESYGKNLLYLRDQIKDLSRNATDHERRIELLSSQVAILNVEIEQLQNRHIALHTGDEVAGLVDTIGELTRRIITVQKERQALEELESDEQQFIRLGTERQQLHDELSTLNHRTDGNELRAIQLRASWRERIRYWLEVLQTKNVSMDVVVDADFDVSFGPEKLSQLKGSTLLRVVLAIRTAGFEMYMREVNGGLRFLILDTPRQQDIEREALASYVAELKKLAMLYGAQIVFSTTDYHYEGAMGDKQWSPTFAGVQQKMFLREASSRS